MHNKKKIIEEIAKSIGESKNIVISGEVGVGKITNTLDALRDTEHVYYIGNPVDYVGKPRPKGYDKYIHYIMSLKKDMRIIAAEEDILSFDYSALSGKKAILVIDEIYGRGIEQYEKILKILDIEKVKVVLIAGCLKNVGRIIDKCDRVLMIMNDGVLNADKDFVKKMCSILGADQSKEQAELFR